jgi:hypothetical protein
VMKTFSKKLLFDLETNLTKIHATYENPIHYSEQALTAIIDSMDKLKTFVTSHTFKDETEEIEFFKFTKPDFASKLLYYHEVYSIELAKPGGSGKAVKKYYKGHRARLQNFHNENTEFYKYYRSNNTILDEKYFIRGEHDIKSAPDSTYFYCDPSFSTPHDYKIAKIIANDALNLYLDLKVQRKDTAFFPTAVKPLRWTGSKVALVELLYALNTEKVFNNGSLSLNELANHFENIFTIDLGQFNRKYLEMRNRKSIDKTQFLNILTQKLLKRMDDADGK